MAAAIGKRERDMTFTEEFAAMRMIEEEIYSDITNPNNPRSYVEQKWKMFGDISTFVEAIYGDDTKLRNLQDQRVEQGTLCDEVNVALANGRMLFSDKKRSHEAPSELWVQFPESLWRSSDFSDNVA